MERNIYNVPHSLLKAQSICNSSKCHFRQLSAVLLCGSGSLPAGEVRGAWSAYLDTVVEPTGWKLMARNFSDFIRFQVGGTFVAFSSHSNSTWVQRRAPWGCLCTGPVMNPKFSKTKNIQVCSTCPEAMEAEVELMAAPTNSSPGFLSTRGSLLTGDTFD